LCKFNPFRRLGATATPQTPSRPPSRATRARRMDVAALDRALDDVSASLEAFAEVRVASSFEPTRTDKLCRGDAR